MASTSVAHVRQPCQSGSALAVECETLRDDGAPMRWVIGIGWLGFGVLAALVPTQMRMWAAKEGTVEAVSHGLLIVTVAAFVFGAIRGPARGRAGVAAAFAAWLLAEEVDYGAVWGVSVIADRLRPLLGEPNLHNAWSGASYILFGVPLLWLYAGALIRPRLEEPPPDPWQGRGPSLDEARAFVLLAIIAIAAPLMVESWEPELDEWAEMLLYVVLLGTAARAAGLTPPQPGAQTESVTPR